MLIVLLEQHFALGYDSEIGFRPAEHATDYDGAVDSPEKLYWRSCGEPLIERDKK